MVSGGADSVTLLHLFASGELGEHPLRVLHVNHLLRAEHSEDDERFVVGLCQELGVECRVVRYDVGAWAAEEGLNLEDAGRQVRYRFAGEELDAWCAELGVHAQRGRIAVAHTRDDRVETFFMRAISGSGTGGLNALAPTRERIIRPLVDVDRAQVRTWLSERGLAWREDASNADTTRSRALVRSELMPVAERLNPSVRAAIVRTMDLLADDDALLSRMADAFAQDFTRSELDERVEFDREWMSTLERTMARRTVRSALIRAFPHASRIESAHIEALVDGLSDDEFARDLPFGLRAVSEYGTMVILRTDAQVPRVAPSLLSLPGSADLGPAGAISATQTASHDVAGDSRTVVVDADRVRGELTVDSVREGDRMRPLGMTGSRKLSDMLTDAKIPRRVRGAIPVVRDGDEIVWVAGVHMSDRYKVTADTDRAFRLTWTDMPLDGVR
jgi:tRNA(Ile)-lysidine synthase